MQTLLTPPNAQPKIGKSLKLGVLTYALHLAPADLSGQNVCAKSTPGCRASCLNTAGRGIFDSVQSARIRRTNAYFTDRADFMARLYNEIRAAKRVAQRKRFKLAIRLNATSDIPWERVPLTVAGYNFQNIMAAFPRVQFYDYTKIAKRAIAAATNDPTWPRNYHLTFSLAENNTRDAANVLDHGASVAVVFRTRKLCERLIGQDYAIGNSAYAPVIDGDETDARFTDPKHCIVALYAKGKAKKDRSGFVHD